MEKSLALFEKAIKKQSDVVGEEVAFAQAKKAGLGVSKDGHIISCTGHPQLVLLRLIRSFTSDGNMLALVECMDLINELERKDVRVIEGDQAKNQVPETADTQS